MWNREKSIQSEKFSIETLFLETAFRLLSVITEAVT